MRRLIEPSLVRDAEALAGSGQGHGQGTAAPECGNREYMLRGRTEMEADASKKAGPETKYQCRACGHAWRGRMPVNESG